MSSYLADSMNNFTPKKKRGRPPKPTSLSSKITTTINIAVNTLTLSSPAETNSNQIVKQGQPDFFTPLMKVSPSARFKPKKRKSSSSSSSSSSTSSPTKRSKSHTNSTNVAHDVLITPTNSDTPFHSKMINSKALDNIYYITNTPGNNVNHRVANSYMMTPLDQPAPADNLLPAVNIEDDKKYSLHPPHHFMSDSHNHDSFTLAPAHEVANIADASHRISSVSQSISTRNNSAPSLHSSETNQTSIDSTPDKSRVTLERKSPKVLSRSSSDFSLKLMVDDSGKAVLSGNFTDSARLALKESPALDTSEMSPKMVKKPKLTHSNTVIGIENYRPDASPTQLQLSDIGFASASSPNLRRFNSDTFPLESISEHNTLPPLPQTPSINRDYLCSTGLTPSSGIPLNLTPQFNSMMYSMMVLQSPNFKKQQQQWNEDFANASTISMNELVSISKRKEDMDDSSDAKSALKKMIKVKDADHNRS